MTFRVSLALAALFTMSVAGCGGNAARVSGRVTCDGKPVAGSILVSPAGEGTDNTGPAMSATLNEDGRFALTLKTIGKHRLVVSPANLAYPARPGEEYPCDLAPLERELKAGANDLTIELPARPR